MKPLSSNIGITARAWNADLIRAMSDKGLKVKEVAESISAKLGVSFIQSYQSLCHLRGLSLKAFEKKMSSKYRDEFVLCVSIATGIPPEKVYPKWLDEFGFKNKVECVKQLTPAMLASNRTMIAPPAEYEIEKNDEVANNMKMLDEAMKRLTKNEQFVLSRKLKGKTSLEIAREMNVTRAYIGHLERIALKKTASHIDWQKRIRNGNGA